MFNKQFDDLVNLIRNALLIYFDDVSYQECVDIANNYIEKGVLPSVIQNTGLFEEK